MGLESSGRAHWEGDLFSGGGTASLGSGLAGPLEITWKARTEEQGTATNPEELIATAHASCFSMAFSKGLAEAGYPPAALDVEATATFVPGSGITTMVLSVTGDVPGMDEADFLEAAEAAKEGCPVSQALKGNVEITLEASLV